VQGHSGENSEPKVGGPDFDPQDWINSRHIIAVGSTIVRHYGRTDSQVFIDDSDNKEYSSYCQISVKPLSNIGL
jgi:hypothetical protein